ncbi:MAG TPA: META domain-containing protein [Acidimicrobiia bacterium]|nr:META domain-containing protein [Acidimicrobiia bacterium]
MDRIAFLAVLALLATACLGSDFADSVEGSWQMTSGTVHGEEIPVLDSHPITIHFEGDQVGGTAACNSYGGTFSMSGSRITVSNLAMTEMACFPEEVMRAEALFTETITRVGNVALDEALTLSGDGVEMVFEALEPVPDAELTSVTWVLDGLVQGDSVSTPVVDTRGFIELSPNGSVTGDTGCRPLSGRFVISGAEVLINELAADGHRYEPGVADQDDLVLSVIGDGFRVEIDGERLTMLSRGDQGLTFVGDK